MLRLSLLAILATATTGYAQEPFELIIRADDPVHGPLVGGSGLRRGSGDPVNVAFISADADWFVQETSATFDGITLDATGGGCLTLTNAANCKRDSPLWVEGMQITSVKDGPTEWYVDGELYRSWQDTQHRFNFVPEPSAMTLALLGFLVALKGLRPCKR